MALIKNASPQIIDLGTQDLSGRIIKPERDPYPQHLPKHPLLTRKGPLVPVITSTAKLPLLYGKDTFDQDGLYYNHQTRFLEVIAGEGNTVMVQRMMPSDAGVKSNIVLYMDVLETEVPNYSRNSSGDYVIDPATNDYKIDAANPTISGSKIKYITEYNTTTENVLGLLPTKQGTMTATLNNGTTLSLTADETATLLANTVITGTTSNATGTVHSITATDVTLVNVTGTFNASETLTALSGTVTTATISNIATNVPITTLSTMHPILELRAKNQGEYYNNIGFSIESLFLDNVLPAITENVKALPYKLALWERTSAGATPVVFRTLFGEPSSEITFKEKAKNPLTEARFDIEAKFQTAWYNETDVLKSLRYEDYEGLYVYRTNLETILTSTLNREKAYITDTTTTWDDGLDASTRQWFDFNTSDSTLIMDEIHLINPFKCVSTKNKKYFTIMIDNNASTLTGNQKEVTISKSTPIFLNGGSDGTLSNAKYEEQVVAMFDQYADSDSEVMDTAINVESVVYDSGFTLDTKKAMVSFIGLRKDTLVAFSTHDASLGEKYLPLVDERAIAVALKTRLRLAPESEFFGTPVMRAIIVAGTGLLRDGSTLDRIPLTYEVAKKSAKFMGAGNFKWKPTKTFDHGQGAVLEVLVDIEPKFIPAGIKPTLWNDGIVWAQPKDRVQYFFPAIQTVYEDDTSVLNSWTTAFACATLSKIAADAWREFTGTNTLKDIEFTEAVNKYFNERVDGIFANFLTVIPEVVIDEADALRGYSWHMTAKLYAPNMKTVSVYNTTAYRISDLTN